MGTPWLGRRTFACCLCLTGRAYCWQAWPGVQAVKASRNLSKRRVALTFFGVFPPPPCPPSYWQGPLQNVSLPTYIRDAGYTTGIFGKELNANTETFVSPGWDDFFALGGNDEVRSAYRASSASHTVPFSRNARLSSDPMGPAHLGSLLWQLVLQGRRAL